MIVERRLSVSPLSPRRADSDLNLAALLKRRLKDAEKVLTHAQEHLALLEEDLASQSSVGAEGLALWRDEEKAWVVKVRDPKNWAQLRNPYHLDEQFRKWTLCRLTWC